MIAPPPPAATRVVLVRHCEAELAEGVLCGRLDPPLSRAGAARAEALAAGSRALRVAAVYASPARRAAGTAAPIAAAHGVDVVLDPALREVDFGLFEGRTWDEAAALRPATCAEWLARPEEIRFPGGEGYGDVSARAVAAVDALARRHAGATVVVVAHAGVNRAVLAWAIGAPPASAFRLDQRPGAVNVLDRFGDGAWVLRLLNAAAFPPGGGQPR